MSSTALDLRPNRETAIRAARRRTSQAAAAIVGLLPLVLTFALWQLLGSDDSTFAPRPSEWWNAVADLGQAGVLLPAVTASVYTFTVAVILATVIGVAIGVLIGTFRQVRRATGPLLEFCRTMPPPAIVPVAMLLLGPSRTMQIVVVVTAAIWPIVINTATAVRSLHPVMLDSARALHLHLADRIRKVILPCVLPAAVLGLRVAAPICLLITILVEMLTGATGVGALLLSAQRNFLTAHAFGLLLVVGAFGLILNWVLTAAARRLLRAWPPSTRAR